MIDPQKLSEDFKHYLQQFYGWVDENLLNVNSILQIGLLIGFYLVVQLFKKKLQNLLDRITFPKAIKAHEESVKPVLKDIVAPTLYAILLWFGIFVLNGFEETTAFLVLVASLVNAWIVIRIASAFIKDPGWSKLVRTFAWTVAALNIVGLLDETTAFLESLSFTLGKMSFSMLGLIKGVIAIAILFWVFSLLEKLLKKRIMALSNITPSAKELLKKFLRVILVFVGCLIALEAIGIDLTALAVFSGAIGIGIGFGLQQVASNLISGVILLLDRSVKPGDVISLGQTYGRINKLGGRFVSVITRDGTEHLIPNEELITQRVENWSFSDTNVRQKASIGIDYNTDLKKAMALIVQAAEETPRVVSDPAPKCLLMDFADSAISLELRFWIKDAENGLRNVRSEVLLRVWDLFQENDIAIPYPQRDINITSPVEVKMVRDDVS